MKNFKIPEFISNNLTNNQINNLFELTEVQLKWFDIYYPILEVTFAKLLRSNHRKILYYITIDLQGDYIETEIDNKFKRMFDAYYSLFEISKLNRNNIKIGEIIDGEIY